MYFWFSWKYFTIFFESCKRLLIYHTLYSCGLIRVCHILATVYYLLRLLKSTQLYTYTLTYTERCDSDQIPKTGQLSDMFLLRLSENQPLIHPSGAWVVFTQLFTSLRCSLVSNKVKQLYLYPEDAEASRATHFPQNNYPFRWVDREWVNSVKSSRSYPDFEAFLVVDTI